jgi:uncharacterized iron-regulated protein
VRSFKLFFSVLLLSACAHAQNNGLLDGNSNKSVSLREAVSQIPLGSVVVIGENHGLAVHQNQQLQIMQELRGQGHKVSVGLEFFTYTDQGEVDLYRAGQVAEDDFLKAIHWGSPAYTFYRDQALFPNLSEGAHTLALNAPRSLTGKVAQNGLNSLTDVEKAIMPPDFSLGRDSYKERFMEMMPHLPSPAAGDNYFAAQSIWDDTMAWRASEFMKAHPEQTLVIVVGDFHVQYGGGLPDRIHARLPAVPVVAFSQVNTEGLSDSDIQDQVVPSPTYGPRANFLWLAPAKSPAP